MSSLDSTGKILVRARENQGKSIPEMESLTKIRGKYLQALESDQFHLLPGDVYVKGFLHTYANSLNLDAQAVLEKYKKDQLHAAEKDFKNTSRGFSLSRTRGQKKIITASFIVFLAILALIIILIFLGDREAATFNHSGLNTLKIGIAMNKGGQGLKIEIGGALGDK